MLRRPLLATTVAATALTAGAGTVPAQDRLVLSSWLPPRHPIVVNAIEPWAQRVEEATEGRVSIRVLAQPLGAPPAHYDMAVDGVADITYGLHSFVRDDRFLGSRIGQFSFLGDDAVAGSKAFWSVYTGMLDADGEHEGVELLGLFVHGPGVLHNGVRRIETPADLDGLKIRVPGGYINDLMAGLGANTQFMSSGEVYETLSRGVIDGVTFTYEALTAFNLTDYIGYSMTVPGGIYNTTWFLVMNDDAWAGLSPEDQAAIESVSGEAFAELVGGAWNDADAAAIAEIEAAGIEIYPAPDSFLDAMTPLARDLEAQWIEAVGAMGHDGAAALDAFRAATGVEAPY